jgi:PST family polysaccharide transporter
MRSDRSILFNLSATAVAEAGTRVAQFAAVVLIARMLGPTGFGIVGTAWALFQLALPIVQGAPELAGVRNLSANRSGAGYWVVAIGRMKTALAFAAAACICIYAAAVYGLPSRGAAQFSVQALVLFGVATSPAWAARSFQRNDLYAAPRLLQAFLFVAFLGGALALKPTPLAVPAAEFVAWIAASWFSWRLIRPLLPALSRRKAVIALPDLRELRSAICGSGRETFHFAASGIATAAVWWIPVMMAESLFGAASGGQVAAAVRLVTIALVGMQLGLQVFLPMLAKYHGTDSEKFRALVAALAFYSTVAHAAVAAVVAVLAAPLAHLVFGAGFEASVPLIVISAVALVPLGTGSAYGYALIAAGRSDIYCLATVVGCVSILAGQLAGMELTGSANGLLWGLPCFVLNTVALAIVAHGGGLVGSGILSLRRLAPRNIMLFLMQR